MKLGKQVLAELNSINELVEAIYAMNHDSTYKALQRSILYLYNRDALGQITNEHIEFIHRLYDTVNSISLYDTQLRNLLTGSKIILEQ